MSLLSHVDNRLVSLHLVEADAEAVTINSLLAGIESVLSLLDVVSMIGIHIVGYLVDRGSRA